MWYIHTVEFYSAIKKKKDVLPFAATGMDLESTVLSEVNQAKKNTSLSCLYVNKTKQNPPQTHGNKQLILVVARGRYNG